MEYFLITLAIVFGILTPVFGLILIYGFVVFSIEYIKTRKLYAERENENQRKQPPYDDIELLQPPNPRMFSISLIKNKEIIWEDSYQKRDFNL